MATINFKSKLYRIGSWTILRLPKDASLKLPSRGLTMVKGQINNFPFQAPLEPDGQRSHWLRIDETLSQSAKVKAGDTVKLAIETTKDWTEPEIPIDIKKALANDSKARHVWTSITPMARWEWLRWIRATSVLETRKKRIEVACSKLRSGMRRPCCFNSNMCTIPEVSKSGVLIEPNL